MDDVLSVRADTSWALDGAGTPTRGVESVVESGGVLVFPALPFVLHADERRFLDPRWADGSRKSVTLRGAGAEAGQLRGATGNDEQRAGLRALVQRFSDQAGTLVGRLFPHYRGRLVTGNTSFRPVGVEGRAQSWRKDDTRLHIDAFPSNPMRGTRLLRVFTNLNPAGQAREWRVGEPFEDCARRYLPAIARPLPGSAALLKALHVTKSVRSEYDHYMLQLHDRAKADLAYQRDAPQQRVDFAPGTTWVVYSDQVLHAAMGGQYMMEQTLYLPPDALLQPATAPLAVLERLLHRRLLQPA